MDDVKWLDPPGSDKWARAVDDVFEREAGAVGCERGESGDGGKENRAPLADAG